MNLSEIRKNFPSRKTPTNYELTNHPKKKKDFTPIINKLKALGFEGEKLDKAVNYIAPSLQLITRRNFFGVILSGLVWSYSSIIEPVLYKKEIQPDSEKGDYNPETFFNRAYIFLGDSNAGHADKDQKNQTDMHPPGKFLIDDMEKKFKDLHWQGFYIAKNSSEGTEIREQLNLPIVQLLLGRKVIYENLSESDKKKSILVYVTERTDLELVNLLQQKNPKEKILFKSFYPLTINSQNDIETLNKIFSNIQAIDMDKSSGPNTVLNKLMEEYPEEIETLRSGENFIKSAEAFAKVSPVYLNSLPEVTNQEKQLYKQIHRENDISSQEGGKKVELVRTFEAPEVTGQRNLVFTIRKARKRNYKEKEIPQDQYSQTGIHHASIGINNAEAEGYNEYKEELSLKGEQTNVTTLRIPA